MTVVLWDPWDQLCTCGHRMYEHILDWDRPGDGITPDCDYCDCMDYTPQRPSPWSSRVT